MSFKMQNVSSKHKLQRFDPPVYEIACFKIDHLMVICFGSGHSLLRRDFNELYMALTWRLSNRCVEDAQAEKVGSQISATGRSKKC